MLSALEENIFAEVVNHFLLLWPSGNFVQAVGIMAKILSVQW